MKIIALKHQVDKSHNILNSITHPAVDHAIIRQTLLWVEGAFDNALIHTHDKFWVTDLSMTGCCWPLCRVLQNGHWIGVGNGFHRPLPPNPVCSSPATGSPVSCFHIGIGAPIYGLLEAIGISLTDELAAYM